MSIDIDNLMKQAQEMQQRMQDMQKEIASLEVEGISGAGLVSVRLTGQYLCKRVQIDAALMSENKEVIEDLVAAAFNDAVHKVEEGTRGRMASLTAGMDLPKNFKIPDGTEDTGSGA